METITRRMLFRSSATAAALGPMLTAKAIAASTTAPDSATQAESEPRSQDDRLQSEFLMDLSLDTSSPRDVGGGRLVVPVSGGTFDGPRLKGTIITPGADWILQRPDGTRVLDVRALFKTDDGQTIYVSWRGIAYTPAAGGLFARILPVFETGAAKYSWLNNVVAVGVYRPGSGKIAYRVYQIL